MQDQERSGFFFSWIWYCFDGFVMRCVVSDRIFSAGDWFDAFSIVFRREICVFLFDRSRFSLNKRLSAVEECYSGQKYRAEIVK